MVPSLRKKFNESFTQEKYQAFLDELNAAHPGAIEFRVAETAVFVPRDFTKKMLDASATSIGKQVKKWCSYFTNKRFDDRSPLVIKFTRYTPGVSALPAGIGMPSQSPSQLNVSE